MKARFIKPALFVLVGIFLGVYFFQCGNDAGIGSDFDATKYYTKDEVDTMMASYYTQSEVDNLILGNKNVILGGSCHLPTSALTYYTFFGSWSTDEKPMSMMAPVDGVLKDLAAKQTDIMDPDSVIKITVRVNGQNTDLSLQFTSADGTNVKVNSSEVAVSQGDLISLAISEIGGDSPKVEATFASFLFNAEE